MFQIPGVDWLTDHNLISRAQSSEDRVYYLQDMKLILPYTKTIQPGCADTDTSRFARDCPEIHTSVTPVSVKLFPGDDAVKYVLTGNDVTKIKFGYGPRGEGESCTRVKNPFDLCEKENNKKGKKDGSQLSGICVPTSTVAKKVFPSVFSRFEIKATLENVNEEEFTTPAAVKAKVKICSYCKGGSEDSCEERVEKKGKIVGLKAIAKNVRASVRSIGTCCPVQKDSTKWYYDSHEKKCMKCPKGSVAAETGFYCYKKQKA